jgi:hypothetical protein
MKDREQDKEQEDSIDDINENLTKLKKNIYKRYNDKHVKEDAKYFLDWLTSHKIFTIFLLILIILGMDKIVKHLTKRY